MNKRRTGVFLAVLAGVVALAFLIIKLVRPVASEGGEDIVPDMAVQTGRITRADLHQFIVAYGTIQPEPAAYSEVASPVAGVLAQTDCAEGERVARGAVLFRLDSRVAAVAFELAKRNLAYAEQTLERQKKLLAVDGTSQKNYLEAESQFNIARSELSAAETGLSLLRIQAPLAGTIVKINVRPGEAVESSTVLATIIDLDRLVFAVRVPRFEAARVKVGQPVELEPLGTVQGRVVFVGSSIDEKSDTLPVRITVPPQSGGLPGRFLSVRIVTDEHAGCLAVPVVALIANTIVGDSGEIVLVEGERAVRKPVKIGLREGDLVEVGAPGLTEGQVIVTTDAYAIPDGTRVHVVPDTHD